MCKRERRLSELERHVEPATGPAHIVVVWDIEPGKADTVLEWPGATGGADDVTIRVEYDDATNNKRGD